MPIWNPWHGCHKISAGCLNCYVYRRDTSIGKNASIVSKTSSFYLPLQRDRHKVYKLLPENGIVYTCMTSDFFLEEADEWRSECWEMIRKRSDLHFFIITKRIHRFSSCIPEDWGKGYSNVTICCTCENQDRSDFRLPIFLSQPIQHRVLIHEPLLGPINMEKYLSDGRIEKVICGGESGNAARPCNYEWILSIREQCIRQNTEFHFKQTGANFIKEGKTYSIERKLQHSQASRAGIDFVPGKVIGGKWGNMDLFLRIQSSPFRSSFHLKPQDIQYIQNKGVETIRQHAAAFLRERLAPAQIPNDGKQTPMRGHPVFLAQHACGCCCRGCLEKWHGIPQNMELDENTQNRLVDTLMEWIRRQLENTDQLEHTLKDIQEQIPGF